jgi:phosphate starvation-inducible PhoH-like protein
VKSGLREAVEVLQNVPGVRFVNFLSKDVVRLAVVQRIIEAYDRHRAGAPIKAVLVNRD